MSIDCKQTQPAQDGRITPLLAAAGLLIRQLLVRIDPAKHGEPLSDKGQDGAHFPMGAALRLTKGTAKRSRRDEERRDVLPVEDVEQSLEPLPLSLARHGLCRR